MLTMEEALAESTINYTEDQIVKGTVIEVRNKEVLVDIGYKSEGSIPANEFDDIKEVKVGDTFDVLIERLEDRDGMGGWVHYSLLSGVRTVLVEQDMLPLHGKPDPKAPVVARLELGVVARLGECTLEWCELRSGGYTGWAPKVRLWGVEPGELRE